MIVSDINDLGRYACISGVFARAIAWISDAGWRDLADGRHVIDGDRVYALLMTIPTSNESGLRYESHRRYADIQVGMGGNEWIFACPAKDLPLETEYSHERDIAFYKNILNGNEHRIDLASGTAAIFFPEDAHKPCVAPGEPGTVRKLVVKVSVE
jgi:biofilm protein TabA